MAIIRSTNSEKVDEDADSLASSRIPKLKTMAKKIKPSTNSLEPIIDIIVSAESYTAKYKELQKIGEGSYSIVIKSRNRTSNVKVAVKKLKHSYRDKSHVEAIPEVRTLRRLPSHPNILQMLETHFDPTAGRVCLVFELMEMNLYELIKDRKKLLGESRVRGMLFQLMRALRHLHRHGIFHRDVKPENILVQTREERDLIKLADLGSVRETTSKPPYTEYISTRWYRSPECLLTSGRYNIKMDVWAAGCVFYEVLTLEFLARLRPLFPGTSEIDQINKIHNIMGMPSDSVLEKLARWGREGGGKPAKQKQSRFEAIKIVLHGLRNRSENKEVNSSGKKQSPFVKLLPAHITPGAHDLLKVMLEYDADLRPSSHRVLQHDYFLEWRLLQTKAQKQTAQAKKPSISSVKVSKSDPSPERLEEIIPKLDEKVKQPLPVPANALAPNSTIIAKPKLIQPVRTDVVRPQVSGIPKIPLKSNTLNTSIMAKPKLIQPSRTDVLRPQVSGIPKIPLKTNTLNPANLTITAKPKLIQPARTDLPRPQMSGILNVPLKTSTLNPAIAAKPKLIQPARSDLPRPQVPEIPKIPLKTNSLNPTTVGRLTNLPATRKRRPQIGQNNNIIGIKRTIPILNTVNPQTLKRRSNDTNFFSSDEDAVTTMKQKFQALIRQRAKERNLQYAQGENYYQDSEDVNFGSYQYSPSALHKVAFHGSGPYYQPERQARLYGPPYIRNVNPYEGRQNRVSDNTARIQAGWGANRDRSFIPLPIQKHATGRSLIPPPQYVRGDLHFEPKHTP